MVVEKDQFFGSTMKCRNGGVRLAVHDGLLEVQTLSYCG